MATLPATAQEGDGPVVQVVGGRDVPDGAYPFIAAILTKDQHASDYDRQFCGGTLVDDNWVLTAAHCVEVAGRDLSVTVGRTVLSSDQGERFDVVEAVLHPRWEGINTLDYDLALLRLAGTSSIQPVAISRPTDTAYEEPGTLLTLAGWGNVDPSSGFVKPDRMQQIRIPVTAAEDCHQGRLDESIWICAGSDDGGGCNGDSGGPLFGTYPDGSFVQFGVVSHGIGPCGGVGAFADLNDPHISEFIRRTTGGRESDPCEDHLDPQGELLAAGGERVTSGSEQILRADYAGILCHRRDVDTFHAFVESQGSGLAEPYVEARMTFDSALGEADLRIRSCDGFECEEIAPTDYQAGAGLRTLRWVNPGDPRAVQIDVVLQKVRRQTLDYKLTLAVNQPPPPPPPPTCVEGVPPDIGTFFKSPGTASFNRYLCPAVPYNFFSTDLPTDTELAAALRIDGAATVQIQPFICDWDGLCEEHPPVITNGAVDASLRWTNCTGDIRAVYLDVTLLEGDGPVPYQLDVMSVRDPANCTMP